MKEQMAIAYLKIVKKGMEIGLLEKGQKREAEINEQAFEKAMKSLEAQISLNECIANLDNPVFEHVTWTHAELLKLLKDFTADHTERGECDESNDISSEN